MNLTMLKTFVCMFNSKRYKWEC